MKKDLNWIKQLQMKIIGYKSETHLERGKQKKGGRGERETETERAKGWWGAGRGGTSLQSQHSERVDKGIGLRANLGNIANLSNPRLFLKNNLVRLESGFYQRKIGCEYNPCKNMCACKQK